MLKLKPVNIEGISFYIKTEPLIIDDTNIKEATLGARRLHLLANNVRLFKLKNAIFFMGDFIKAAESGYYFIDSNGLIFTYNKTRNVPLVFHKILEVIPIKSGGAVLTIEGIPQRFKCLNVPTTEKYAGLLKLSKLEYVLYGLYDNRLPNSRRKI